MHPVQQEILEALKTYQWTPTAVVYNFALHLHYTENYIKRFLDELVASGQIDKVVEGTTHGKTRHIYKLIEKS